MSPVFCWPEPKYLDPNTTYKNHLTNLSTLPQPITRTWEFTIPLPHWIPAFFHIDGGLVARIEITILAHQTTDFYNTFCLEISVTQYSRILFPHWVEELRIVLGYLWHNHFYQVREEEIIHTPSRVSLSTGVTASENSTCIPTPSPPSSLEPIVPPNHFTSYKSHLHLQYSQGHQIGIGCLSQRIWL